MLAIEEVNASDSYDLELEPVVRDPGGQTEKYQPIAEAMFRENGCRQFVGTITSSGRKAVIPVVEKHDGLLWYTCPYEGFECSENVIYGGACPSHHILPLFSYLVPRYGNRVYVLGSDYVWAWENSRITREILQAFGGEVLGDHFLPVESTEAIPAIIEEIRRSKPDFVFNNLIGETGYAFLKAYHEQSLSDPSFASSRRPIVSAGDLTECEIDAIGREVAVGLLSSSTYFHTLDTPEAKEFRKRVARRFGADRRMSAFGVHSYIAVHALARAIAETGSENSEAIKQVHFRAPLHTPIGEVRISARTNHAALRPYLGRVESDGNFSIIDVGDRPIVADPYLVKFDRLSFSGLGRSKPYDIARH